MYLFTTGAPLSSLSNVDIIIFFMAHTYILNDAENVSYLNSVIHCVGVRSCASRSGSGERSRAVPKYSRTSVLRNESWSYFSRIIFSDESWDRLKSNFSRVKLLGICGLVHFKKKLWLLDASSPVGIEWTGWGRVDYWNDRPLDLRYLDACVELRLMFFYIYQIYRKVPLSYGFGRSLCNAPSVEVSWHWRDPSFGVLS